MWRSGVKLKILVLLLNIHSYLCEQVDLHTRSPKKYFTHKKCNTKETYVERNTPMGSIQNIGTKTGDHYHAASSCISYTIKQEYALTSQPSILLCTLEMIFIDVL